MRGNPLCVDTARFLSFTHHSIHKRFRKGPRPFFCSSAQQASWLVAVFFSSVESGPPLPPPPETNLSTFQSPPDASVCVCVCVCVCALLMSVCASSQCSAHELQVAPSRSSIYNWTESSSEALCLCSRVLSEVPFRLFSPIWIFQVFVTSSQ
jgi:hypothetical protein